MLKRKIFKKKEELKLKKLKMKVLNILSKITTARKNLMKNSTLSDNKNAIFFKFIFERLNKTRPN